MPKALTKKSKKSAKNCALLAGLRSSTSATVFVRRALRITDARLFPAVRELLADSWIMSLKTKSQRSVLSHLFTEDGLSRFLKRKDPAMRRLFHDPAAPGTYYFDVVDAFRNKGPHHGIRWYRMRVENPASKYNAWELLPKMLKSRCGECIRIYDTTAPHKLKLPLSPDEACFHRRWVTFEEPAWHQTMSTAQKFLRGRAEDYLDAEFIGAAFEARAGLFSQLEQDCEALVSSSLPPPVVDYFAHMKKEFVNEFTKRAYSTMAAAPQWHSRVFDLMLREDLPVSDAWLPLPMIHYHWNFSTHRIIHLRTIESFLVHARRLEISYVKIEIILRDILTMTFCKAVVCDRFSRTSAVAFAFDYFMDARRKPSAVHVIFRWFCGLRDYHAVLTTDAPEFLVRVLRRFVRPGFSIFPLAGGILRERLTLDDRRNIVRRRPLFTAEIRNFCVHSKKWWNPSRFRLDGLCLSHSGRAAYCAPIISFIFLLIRVSDQFFKETLDILLTRCGRMIEDAHHSERYELKRYWLGFLMPLVSVAETINGRCIHTTLKIRFLPKLASSSIFRKLSERCESCFIGKYFMRHSTLGNAMKAAAETDAPQSLAFMKARSFILNFISSGMGFFVVDDLKRAASFSDIIWSWRPWRFGGLFALRLYAAVVRFYNDCQRRMSMQGKYYIMVSVGTYRGRILVRASDANQNPLMVRHALPPDANAADYVRLKPSNASPVFFNHRRIFSLLMLQQTWAGNNVVYDLWEHHLKPKAVPFPAWAYRDMYRLMCPHEMLLRFILRRSLPEELIYIVCDFAADSIATSFVRPCARYYGHALQTTHTCKCTR